MLSANNSKCVNEISRIFSIIYFPFGIILMSLMEIYLIACYASLFLYFFSFSQSIADNKVKMGRLRVGYITTYFLVGFYEVDF